jgi:hypothetical protein
MRIKRIVLLGYLYTDATMVPENAIIPTAEVSQETRLRPQ